MFSTTNDRFIQIKCIAYGSTARELYAYWSSIRANVVLCVLTFWQIEWGEGIITIYHQIVITILYIYILIYCNKILKYCFRRWL